MFTKFIKNNEKFFLFILTVSFFATFSVLLYVGHSKAQTFPPPPINENEVEDLNLFQGSATGGRSNVLLGIDFSGSMGTNKAGAQFGNWDGTNIIDSCDNLQRIKDESAAGANKPPQDFAIAHCAANASGITTELVDKDGFVIHSSYSTTTVVTDSTITISTIHPDATIMRTTDGIVESFNNGIAYEGVFRGCGARACTRSKFGTCEDPRDFERFLTCIDIAYSDVLCPTCPATPDDTIVLSVFNTALTVNCAGTATDSTNVASLKSDLINQCDPTADGVTGFDDNDSDGISGYRERISATAAMDNYANYLYAEAQEAAGLVADANDLKTCGGAKCITLNDATVDNTDDFEPDTGPSAVEDHSCRNGTELGSGGGGGGAGGGGSTVNQYDRFAACMAAASQKQPTVRSCSTGGSDAPFCSPAQYGSTRADAMMAVLFQILDRDSSLKTTDCNDTDRLFNGETPISCFNYMNTPYRELGTLPDVTGGGQLPVVGGGKQIESFLTTEDAVLAGFRINGFRFFDIGITGGANTCTTQSSYDTDQGGFAGGSELKFQNTYGELGDIQPTGRTGLAHAIGFDDGDGSGTTISDDALGIYRVEIQTDPGGSECRGNFAIFITDGEDNCSGDCSANPAFGLDDMACDNSIPPETGNSNRRSVLQAASYLRTHFSRFGTNDNASDPDGIEIITFYIGWGLKDNPQGVRNLNAAALLGGTHSSGLLRHMGPQGFVVGNVDLDGSVGVSALLSQADIAEINSNFPWVLEMAEMEVPTGDFASDPAAVTLQDCDVANISESGSCTWDGTSVFDNNFFDGTVGTSVPTVLTKTEIGESFAFFVDNPGELVSVLEIAFDFIRGFSSVGQAPSVPPSVTAIGLRDRVLLPSFAPIIGEPIWQGRLALYGFLDDPDIPGGKIIVRKPSSDSEFIKTVDGVDVLDGDAINSAKIFNDSGSLNSNAEGFFWDAGKLLAERDIVNSARNLITVDSTIFGTQIIDTAFFFDAIVYTTGLVAFDKNLDPEVFGISDQDVDPLGTGSIISICTDVCPDGVGEICDSSVSPLSDACKTCVKEDCLRDKIVDFMSGNTGLLPIAD
nr:hypothetical protein [Candidatus Dadabacteria bacterium]NIS08289.1 hypothetical protein [Candidatus Dadabacteria bacterium]NIV12154.1 hypothetical protein [Fodinibius sp.]NIY21808.1 hypothetical protein [Candidatus Dadabacteria bacterium]